MLEEILKTINEEWELTDKPVPGEGTGIKAGRTAGNDKHQARAEKKRASGHYIVNHHGRFLHEKPFPSAEHAIKVYNKIPSEKSKGLRILKIDEGVDTSKLSKKLQKRLADRAVASGKKAVTPPTSAAKAKSSPDLKRRIDVIAAAAKKREAEHHEKLRDAIDRNRDAFGGSQMGGYTMGSRISYSGLGEAVRVPRHPLADHPYHSKSNEQLKFIIKDAGEAAKAMQGHNLAAEAKYRDQVNDAATVLHHRNNIAHPQTGHLPDWYLDKYFGSGHSAMNEHAVHDIMAFHKELGHHDMHGDFKGNSLKDHGTHRIEPTSKMKDDSGEGYHQYGVKYKSEPKHTHYYNVHHTGKMEYLGKHEDIMEESADWKVVVELPNGDGMSMCFESREAAQEYLDILAEDVPDCIEFAYVKEATVPYVGPAFERDNKTQYAWKAMNKHGKTQYFNTTDSGRKAAERHAGEGHRVVDYETRLGKRIHPETNEWREVDKAPATGDYEYSPGDQKHYYVREHIIKVGNKYRLVSKKTGKNLGTYTSRAGAVQREREVEYFKHMGEDVESVEEMFGANMNTRDLHRHLKKQGWYIGRTSGSHDIFVHKSASHHLSVPRHSQLKAPLVKDILKASVIAEGAKGSAADTIKSHPAVEYYGGHEDDHFINLKPGYNREGMHSYSNPNANVARGSLKGIKKCDANCDSCESAEFHRTHKYNPKTGKHEHVKENNINEVSAKLLTHYIQGRVQNPYRGMPQLDIPVTHKAVMKTQSNLHLAQKKLGVDYDDEPPKVTATVGRGKHLATGKKVTPPTTNAVGTQEPEPEHKNGIGFTANVSEEKVDELNTKTYQKYVGKTAWTSDPKDPKFEKRMDGIRRATEKLAKRGGEKAIADALVAEDMKIEPEDLKDKVRRKYLGAKRGTTKVGTPAHAIDVSHMKEDVEE